MKKVIIDKRIFYAGLVYFISILLFIGVRILWGTGLFSSLDPIMSDLFFSTTVQIVILGVLPFFLWKALTKQTLKQCLDRCFIKKIPFKTILVSILLGVLCYVVIVFVSTFWSFIIGFLGYSGSSGGTSSTLPVWLAFALTIVTTSIMPGIFEEGMHRGILMGNARNNGIKRAILLSALMFALAHLNVPQFGYAFVVGLILGAITFITRSIFPAIIVHGTSNLCSTYFSYASTYDWIGGNLFDNLSNFVSQNWLSGMILMFLIISIVITLIAILFVRLFVYTRSQKFKQFKTNLKKSVAGTEEENLINFNNDVELYAMFTKAFTNDLTQKIESGALPFEVLEKEVNNNPIYALLYSEFDDYKKPEKLDYLFYYLAILLGSLVTFFTFIWGLF